MKTKELEFDYPKELIATEPVSPRDTARLMVLDKKNGEIVGSNFKSLPEFLKKGDLLVFNETKVFPARLRMKKETGGKIEILFLGEVSEYKWEVLLKGAGKVAEIELPNRIRARVLKESEGTFLLVDKSHQKIINMLEKYGEVPLPPYIKRGVKETDKKDYQTVFAKIVGSAAAPTAGLHFTKNLLEKIHLVGAEIIYVTLDVGLGTFQPVKTEKLEDHPIHSERYEVGKKAAMQINRAKKEGRRIIAVGTTVVRVLESAYKNGQVDAGENNTNLFIYPGYKFQVVDALVTNFHTPKSSLLGLVYAFAGTENVKNAYKKAIKEKYRLFSYGDGMFIK